MKTLLMSAIVGLAMLLPAVGRIGETPAQCEARYGKPVKIDKEKERIWYRKGGLEVLVLFHDGKADHLFFEKSAHDELDLPLGLSTAEIEVLLNANFGDNLWSKLNGLVINSAWTTDGKICAFYRESGRQLCLFTDAGRKRMEAETAADESRKLEGF